MGGEGVPLGVWTGRMYERLDPVDLRRCNCFTDDCSADPSLTYPDGDTATVTGRPASAGRTSSLGQT